MHAFRDSARWKHFIGGDGDLDHRFFWQKSCILILRERGIFILILHGRDGMLPMNSVDRTYRSGQCIRNEDRRSVYRCFWSMKRR